MKRGRTSTVLCPGPSQGNTRECFRPSQITSRSKNGTQSGYNYGLYWKVSLLLRPITAFPGRNDRTSCNTPNTPRGGSVFLLSFQPSFFCGSSALFPDYSSQHIWNGKAQLNTPKVLSVENRLPSGTHTCAFFHGSRRSVCAGAQRGSGLGPGGGGWAAAHSPISCSEKQQRPLSEL